MAHFERLFTPLTIRGVTIRNRIVMPPMNSNFAEADGSVSERFLRFHLEPAKGGTGLIIVSSAYVDPTARKRKGALLIHDDRFIPKLRELSERVHAAGAKVFQPLNHNGRLLTSSKELKTAATGVSVGPSPIPHLARVRFPTC